MSYLKLDKTRINYTGPSTIRGGMILSQVIDAKSGPPSPVLISSTTDLDVYFGRSFKEREYFDELVSGGVELLLGLPKKLEHQDLPVIDTSGYEVIKELPISEDISVPILDVSQLPETGEEETKYYVSTEDEYYIYPPEYGWTKVSDLPSTQGILTNRDTLRLVSSGWGKENNLPWCWPKYSGGYIETPDTTSLLGSLKDGDPYNPHTSIGFTLKFTEKITPVPDSQWTYIIFPVPESSRIQFYLGSPINPDIVNTPPQNRFPIPETTLQDQIDFIITTLREYGWTCTSEDGLSWEMYTRDILPDLGFYNIPGLEFYGNPRVTHNILSILSDSHKKMEFSSKSIGKGDEEIKIQVTKVPGKSGWYRVVLSKYSYQEVFEGPLRLELYDENSRTYISLEKLINQGSSLVSVKVYPGNDPEEGLPEGEYTLSGATQISDWTPQDYWRGLEDLREFGVSEDFLMVPRIEDYLITGVRPGESWYSEYEDLLEYSVTKNCQVLITNHPYYLGCLSWDSLEEPRDTRPDSPERKHLYFIGQGGVISAETWDGREWTVLGDSGGRRRWKEIIETFTPGYTGNQIFNYLRRGENEDSLPVDLDPDNRLIYFYQDMTYLGWPRPGWYIFLKGILEGKYTMTTDNIVYPSPAKYYTEDETVLEKSKSNLLSGNGHLFYYRRLFSHPGDYGETHTILGRFCVDKISNTISRDFPRYLSKETSGERLRGLQGILTSLRSKYPIIHVLEVESIEENNSNLSVYLNLGIRETLDKDIKLSVTLNFNFN